jgi:hypothetical protein
MKTKINFFAVTLLLRSAASALAGVHYVDVNSTNATPPYTNWATAATNIQDAVDAAVTGDEVIVTNGLYTTGVRNGNRVDVDKPLIVRSANGPQLTSIDGGNSFRCVHLTNNASLTGFTLTNGLSSIGAGLLCESGSAAASNCVVTGNTAFYFGGGAYQGTLIDCMLIGNLAHGRCDTKGNGGGAAGATLNNCALSRNSAYFEFPAVTFGCLYPPYHGDYGDGGGAYFCTLNNCTLTGNSAINYFNFSENTQDSGHYGDGGGAYRCALNNCTLAFNTASDSSGTRPSSHTLGAYGEGGGAYASAVNNSIVYFNTNFGFFVFLGASGKNLAASWGTNCCTTPDAGFGSITNAPLFLDMVAGNLRLQSNSPCINAGNNAFAPDGPDLDGNPRIAGGTVDIGAYEFQSPVSQISFAWLQQFNLPINPATDTADPDGDGVDNYHEWLAHSDPTNPFSFPPVLSLIPYGPNVILTWPTNAFGFTLQSSTNLSSPVWGTNSLGPVIIGGQNVIINPITGTQQFYRLVQ